GRRPRCARSMGRKGNSRRPHFDVTCTGEVPRTRARFRHEARPTRGVPMGLARTSGLAFEVDDALRGVVTLAWLEADVPALEPHSAAFVAERAARVDSLRARFAGKAPADIPGVAENRTLFHRLGIDPTKTRPASEALLRRVLKGQAPPE